MSNFSCCKAIQVYDEEEGKVVDIPKEEVEAVQNSRRIYFVIERNYSEARKNGISNQEFLTGLLRFAVAGLESNVRQSPELDKKVQRIWESVSPKLTQAGVDAIDSEDDRDAIAKFKKPYKQLSDAEKEILEEDLDDRNTLDAITYCLITRAFDIWTPESQRSDAIAAKIKEKDEAEVEKEKAKAEKRVPVGN